MTDEVVTPAATESANLDVQDNLPAAEEPTQGAEDVTTWKVSYVKFVPCKHDFSFMES